MLRRQGVKQIVNSPVDTRTADLYESLGFKRGRTLELTDLPSLKKAFSVIEYRYAQHGLSLRLPP